MASLREIRRKIKSVKSTEQITRAMKMVAAARMRRSQTAILSARPFARKMEALVGELAALERAEAAAQGQTFTPHEFFQSRFPEGPAALVLVTADKGLCGGFNANLIRAALEWLRGRSGKKSYIAVVGRKGRDFMHRVSGFDCEVFHEMAGIFPKVSFTHAEILGKAVMECYRDRKLSGVWTIFNEFKSVSQQRVVLSPLLPVPEGQLPAHEADLSDVGFEPDKHRLLSVLLPRHLKAQIYRILLESQAAELAARMNAMDAASKNAQELRGALNLNLNRQRQAIITREIAELVGGAEALAS